MMHPAHIGRLLKRLREDNAWSQEDLARRLGISRQALFLLETGRGFPSFPLALKIAKIFRDMNQSNDQGKEADMLGRGFDPFAELDRLHKELDRMFSQSIRPLPGRRLEGFGLDFPAVNIREIDQDILIEATLPGVTAKDVQINVTEDRVSLKGERKSEEKIEDMDFVRREYSYGSFSREVMLPTAVKAEEADASLKNGLLTIRVPKRQETKPAGREITINEE